MTALRHERSAAVVREGRVGTFLASRADEPTVWAGAPIEEAPFGIYVHRSYRDQLDGLSNLGLTLWLAGSGATLASAVFGGFLAAALARRLRAAAAAVARIAAGEPANAMPLRGSDEVADLGRAVDDMARSLRAQLQREQRYAADVAHELRTPVAGLVSAVELVGDEPHGALVRERVLHLRRLVESLLEVARLDAGQEVADVRNIDLGLFVRETVSARGVTVVEEERDLHVRTDPRRLERVVTNLIDNALLHGAPPVEVRVSGAGLEVRDHGPGLPAHLTSRAMERFVTAATDDRRSTGLGLAIAAGQAAVIGAHLHVANHPDGGALATVELPPAEQSHPARVRAA